MNTSLSLEMMIVEGNLDDAACDECSRKRVPASFCVDPNSGTLSAL